MTRRRPEQQLQKAVFEHLAWRAALGVFAFHCPNGGWRSAIEAAIFRGLGTVAGIPDVLVVRDGKLHARAQSRQARPPCEAQYERRAHMRAAGCVIETAYTIDEAIAFLSQWRTLR